MPLIDFELAFEVDVTALAFSKAGFASQNRNTLLSVHIGPSVKATQVR